MSGAGKLWSWSLADKKPNPSPMEIVQLHVSGEEFDYVRLKFRNLPITAVGPCVWSGELARFIFDNL